MNIGDHVTVKARPEIKRHLHGACGIVTGRLAITDSYKVLIGDTSYAFYEHELVVQNIIKPYSK